MNLSDEMILTIEDMLTWYSNDKNIALSNMEQSALDLIQEMALPIHQADRRWKTALDAMIEVNG